MLKWTNLLYRVKEQEGVIKLSAALCLFQE